MPAKSLNINVTAIEFEADGVMVKQDGSVLEDSLMRAETRRELRKAESMRHNAQEKNRRRKLKRHGFG